MRAQQALFSNSHCHFVCRRHEADLISIERHTVDIVTAQTVITLYFLLREVGWF